MQSVLAAAILFYIREEVYGAVRSYTTRLTLQSVPTARLRRPSWRGAYHMHDASHVKVLRQHRLQKCNYAGAGSAGHTAAAHQAAKGSAMMIRAGPGYHPGAGSDRLGIVG